MRIGALRQPRSLRWRLTVWVAAVMVAAAGLLLMVVLLKTDRTLDGQIDHDLREDMAQVRHALSPYRASSPAVARAAAIRFVGGLPYHASSTLLFVIGAGGAVVSNHPELFGPRRAENGESAGEQRSENRDAQRLERSPLGLSEAEVPDVGRVRVLAQRIPLAGASVLVAAGEPLATIDRAQKGIAGAFVVAGALSLLLALVASYLAGARVTAPLRRMAAVAARVDAGELEPRMEETAGTGEEVRVLAESFNHMLDRLADAFRGQREFIADASHELRTPLTVIRGQLEVLAALEHPPPEEVARVERVVQSEVTRMARLVDDLLLLTAAEQLDFLRVEEIDLREFVSDLWDGLSLTARRRFELGYVPDGMLRADPDRLAQALRNLARNAIEHTAEEDGLVRLEVSVADGRVEFAVIDDGPGIPPEERERVFERLYRTDRSRSRVAGGAGLGLAIVRAIAEAHHGTVLARPGPAGSGTRIELRLPFFRPRGESSPASERERSHMTG